MLACLSSGWNCFDFFVVCSSLLLLLFPDTPGISHLRTVRVLRVLRLFARVRSLRLIIIALASSVVPVLNAMVLMALVTSIFAIRLFPSLISNPSGTLMPARPAYACGDSRQFVPFDAPFRMLATLLCVYFI